MRNSKIERLAKALSDELILRLGSATNISPATVAYDASGDAYLLVTRAVSDTALVKFEPEPFAAGGQYDSLGLAQVVYSPHVTKLGFSSGVIAVQAHDTATLRANIRSGDILDLNGNPFEAMEPGGGAGDQWELVGTPATGTILLAGVVAGDALQIYGNVMTADAAIQDADHFIVGASDIDTATNLVTCIGANPANSLIVTAANAGGTSATVTVTAKQVGVVGNAYGLTDGPELGPPTGHYTMSGLTMAGGVMDLTASAVNLAAAIAASTTAGVQGFVTATSAFAVVTITAVTPGVAANTYTVTNAFDRIHPATATLTGGVDGVLAGTSGALKALLCAVCAPTGTALLVYEKPGIVLTDMAGMTNLVVAIRNIAFGQLAQM